MAKIIQPDYSIVGPLFVEYSTEHIPECSRMIPNDSVRTLLRIFLYLNGLRVSEKN